MTQHTNDAGTHKTGHEPHTHDVSAAKFWQDRYDHGHTGWDIGKVSPPLQAYIEHLLANGVSKNVRMLIPGAGNAYEAAFLHALGFGNVTVADFAKQPLDNFANANPSFPKAHLLQADFFGLDPAQYQFDFIIEQTFFCAIDPSRREEYAQQMAKLLKPSGELFGVMFDRDFDQGPPFGGHRDEYQALFARYFDIKTLAPCYNSVGPRQGSELFVRLTPKT